MTSETDIERTILDLAAARGIGKTICPSEAARAIAGPDPQAWSRLMPAIRRVAIGLMKAGLVAITRKGRPVDPEDFRGVYRIAIVPGQASPPPQGKGDHAVRLGRQPGGGGTS